MSQSDLSSGPAKVVPLDDTTLESHHAKGWAAVDAQLSDWALDPASSVDYDAVPPSLEVIRLARSLVPELRQAQWPAPAMVVPDLDGGISFEFHTGGLYEDLEILKSGEVWLTEIRAGCFQGRKQIR